MALPARIASRLYAVRCAANCTRTMATVSNGTAEHLWPQRQPLGEYYNRILNTPTPYPFSDKPEEPPNTADPTVLPDEKKPMAPKQKPGRKPKNKAAEASPTPSDPPQNSPPVHTPPPSTPEEAARRIFGTRLYGEEEKARHIATKQAQSTYKAGVLIPPRPEEPDNCCMSGCVNCVWDRFREDVEEWSSKVKEAEALMAKAETPSPAVAEQKRSEQAASPRGEEDKISKDMWDENAFQGVPLGIREFMKLEKQLKDRHAEEHTTGG